MKITGIKAYVADVPPPFKGGKRFVFCRLSTDEGIEGVGECTWHGMQDRVYAALMMELFEPYIQGADPFNIEKIWWDIYGGYAKLHPGPISTGVLSAIEMACWDIVGKAVGQPIYNLLGGVFNDRLRAYTYLYGWHQGEPPEKAAEDSIAYVEKGFTAIKLDPVNYRTSERLDTLRYAQNVIQAIRDAVGDRCDILIGTHGQFSTHSAIRFAKRVEEYDPLWFEEPVAPENIGEMARVAQSTSIPIATGERLLTRYDFVELLEKKAAAIIQMDLSSTGGILEGKKIAAMADTYYAQIAPHMWGGPVSWAAAIQLDVCTPNLLIQEGIETWSGFHRDIVKEPIVWQDGYIIPPTKPGLGIELDYEFLEKHSEVCERT